MAPARLARLLAQRVIKIVAVVLAIAVTNFLLIHAAPGDPASVIAGESGAADPQLMAQLRAQFGLDQPLTTQLALYLNHVLHGDLGTSFRQGRPVAGLILERLPATLLLTLTAFVFAIVTGITLGAMAAQTGRTHRRQRHHRARARLLRDAAVLGRVDAGAAVQRVAELAAQLRHEHASSPATPAGSRSPISAST